MAKCIYLCSKDNLPDSIASQLDHICKELAPDNIVPAEPKIVVNGKIAYAVMNPTKTLLESRNSLLLGQIFHHDERWGEPLQEFPDGSYALFRDGEEYFEIVSDAVATRTIWYYHDEKLFIASTSQRAIIMFIGSFEFEERVIPWMLSTGSLGPVFSWDKRIKRLPPDSSVTLNKNNWTLSLRSNPVEFDVVERSDEEHKKIITEALEATFASLKVDCSSWALPLSGGYDSRAILCLLLQNTSAKQLRTITWGLESSIHLKGNDAYVAKELANKLNVTHKYYHTDLSDEPIDRTINRFVLLGEGRIDHLAGYMDGFKLWKNLFEDGVDTTIRGDEGFGFIAVTSPLQLRIQQSCGLCSDFSNLKNYKKYGFSEQEMPETLKRRNGEKLTAWRDRVYQQYRMPVIQAALADLKFHYVEQISPFFFKTILRQARHLPEHLVIDRNLFKKIVISISPKMEFARGDATASFHDILKEPRVVKFLKDELSSTETQKVFPAEFIDFVLRGIKTESNAKPITANRFSTKLFINRLLPNVVKNAIRKVVLPDVDPNVLAFRVFLIKKMHQVLNADCQ